MKYLIYQYYSKVDPDKHIIETGYDYYDYSRKSISAYAAKYGIEYKFIDKKIPLAPFYGIFLPFTEGWCHDYDAVCFIDSDIMATQNSKNVFDAASNEEVSVYFMDTQDRLKRICGLEWWAYRGHANSGVTVFPRNVYNDICSFVSDLEKLHNTTTVVENSLGKFDQAIINKFLRHRNNYKILDSEFNYHLGRLPHDKRFSQSLIHYHRKHKNMIATDYDKEEILK